MFTSGPPTDHAPMPLARLRRVALRRAVSAGLSRADAEDLAQDVTVSVDRKRPSNPEAYAAGATRRAIALHWRRSATPTRVASAAASEPAEGCPLTTLLAHEDAALTVAALDALVLWNPAARAVVVEVDACAVPDLAAAESLVRFYLRLLHRLPLNERTRRRRAAALCARIADLRERTTRRRKTTTCRPEVEGSVHWRLARALAFVGWVDREMDAHGAAALVLSLEAEAADPIRVHHTDEG